MLNYENMHELHAFTQSCQAVIKLMTKNHYYKPTDFNKAVTIAYNYIFLNKKVNLLKCGNLKLEKNVLIFDLPTIMTCKYACSKCYAVKSERIYANTRIMRLYHLILIEYATRSNAFKHELLQDFYKQIEASAKEERDLQVIRWHGAGDFYSKKYLQLFLQLCNMLLKLKNVRVYTYTKQLDNNIIDNINNKYVNLNVVKSLIGGRFINYGNSEYLQHVIQYCKNNNMPYYICNYGETHADTCMGTCKRCLYCPHVLFHQH